MELDLVMRQLIDAQKGLQAHQSTLDRIRQSILKKEDLVRSLILFPHPFI